MQLSPAAEACNHYWIVRCQTNLGCALADEGRHEQAIVEFQNVLRIDPKCYQAHYGLGLALQKQGKVDKAIAHHQKALESNPKCAAAHYNLGLIREKQGRRDEAVALAKSAQQAVFASRIQSRLDLYRAGRPYRETPQKPSSAPDSQ